MTHPEPTHPEPTGPGRHQPFPNPVPPPPTEPRPPFMPGVLLVAGVVLAVPAFYGFGWLIAAGGRPW